MNLNNTNYRNFVESELKFNTPEENLLYYYYVFCNYNNDRDNFIYINNEDFFNNFFSAPWWAVVAVSNNDTYSIKDNFVMLSKDGYTAISYNNIWDAMNEPDLFIDYMCENQNFIDMYNEKKMNKIMQR